MKYFSLSPIFASTYNCGAYGIGSYDSGSCTTQTGGTGTTNGSLTNTGANVYLPLTIGVVLVAAALTIITVSIVKKLRAAKK